jgi:PAS domain S-box-containing protein
LELALVAGGVVLRKWEVRGDNITWSGECHAPGLGTGGPPQAVAAVHPEDRSVVEAAIRQAVGERTAFQVEYRVVWPDGSIRWMSARGQAVQDGRGSVVTVLGAAHDITQERAFQQEREQLLVDRERQKEFLRRLFENSPIGIAVIGRDGRYIMANPRYEANTGRPDLRVAGQHVGQFVPEETRRLMQHIMQQVIETGKPFRLREFEANVGPGREHTWWNNDVVPLFDQKGKVESLLALTDEVTEQVVSRRHIERLAGEMKAGRDQLQAIIEAMTEGLIVADASGDIVIANSAIHRMHGVDQPQKMPRSAAQYPYVFDMRNGQGQRVSHEDWPLARALKGETVRQMELHSRRLDSGTSWAGSYSAVPVRGPDGEIVLGIVTVHDLTQRKHVEQELERTAEELKRSNRDLEQFAYVASHDLQEPLRMVVGHLGLIARRLQDKLDDDTRELLGYAVDGAARMQSLIRDLLLYSRVGRDEGAFVETDVGAVVDRVVEDLKAPIQESGAAIRHGSLPTIKAAPALISQLLQNLIANAIKYRLPQRTPEIDVDARRDGDGWLFSVRDNGIGIRPHDLQRVFIVFQRLHSKGAYAGTGIGLAICKRIVEHHGGRIWAESEPGRGSTFFFWLPDRDGQPAR